MIPANEPYPRRLKHTKDSHINSAIFLLIIVVAGTYYCGSKLWEAVAYVQRQEAKVARMVRGE